MVGQFASLLPPAAAQFDALAWAAEQSSEPVLKRLDPPRQAQVLMVLLGLLMLGGLLIAIVLLGGRRLRRIARLDPRSTRRAEVAWFQKPLVPPPSDPTSDEPQ
jgi:hypothetical protein